MRELHNAIFDVLTMEKAPWWRSERRVWGVGSGVGLYGFIGRFIPEVISLTSVLICSLWCPSSLNNRLKRGGLKLRRLFDDGYSSAESYHLSICSYLLCKSSLLLFILGIDSKCQWSRGSYILVVRYNSQKARCAVVEFICHHRIPHKITTTDVTNTESRLFNSPV